MQGVAGAADSEPAPSLGTAHHLHYLYYLYNCWCRVLLERLIVNRPHPWGLLITFIELIKVGSTLPTTSSLSPSFYYSPLNLVFFTM